MNSLNIAITGAAGRMGKTLIQAVDAADTCVLSSAIQRAGSSLIGVDAGELAGIGRNGVAVSDNLAVADFDLLIDFTVIDACLAHIDIARQLGKAVVIGTTGFNAQQKTVIESAAEEIPIVLAPNTSVGITLCTHLLKQMAPILAEDSDIEIIETHHRHKVDSPSGTAVKLGEVIGRAA